MNIQSTGKHRTDLAGLLTDGCGFAKLGRDMGEW